MGHHQRESLLVSLQRLGRPPARRLEPEVPSWAYFQWILQPMKPVYQSQLDPWCWNIYQPLGFIWENYIHGVIFRVNIPAPWIHVWNVSWMFTSCHYFTVLPRITKQKPLEECPYLQKIFSKIPAETGENNHNPVIFQFQVTIPSIDSRQKP